MVQLAHTHARYSCRERVALGSKVMQHECARKTAVQPRVIVSVANSHLACLEKKRCGEVKQSLIAAMRIMSTALGVPVSWNFASS